MRCLRSLQYYYLILNFLPRQMSYTLRYTGHASRPVSGRMPPDPRRRPREASPFRGALSNFGFGAQSALERHRTAPRRRVFARLIFVRGAVFAAALLLCKTAKLQTSFGRPVQTSSKAEKCFFFFFRL